MVPSSTSHRSALAAILFTLIMGAVTVSADEREVGLGEFGVKFGQLRGGTIEYWIGSDDDRDSIEVDAGLSGGAFLDHPVYQRFHVTAAFDVHQIGEGGTSKAALDVSGGLKYKWTEPMGRLSVRPAASLGFALLPNIWHFSASKYMTLKLYLEVASYSRRGTGLVLEIGSLMTLSGSDNSHDISAGSMFMIRAGILW